MPVFRKDGRNILFVHIPKTGGSSIERAFRSSGYRSLYLDGKLGPSSWNHLRRCPPQHMHGELLELLFRLERFDHIFMVVRDPIARFRSEYLWRHRNKEEFTIDGPTVQRWAKKALRKHSGNPFAWHNHIRPQVDFLVPGITVFPFEEGLDRVLDHLNSTWELGLVNELPRVREGEATTSFASKDVEITPELEDNLRDFYREDFVRFGY